MGVCVTGNLCKQKTFIFFRLALQSLHKWFLSTYKVHIKRKRKEEKELKGERIQEKGWLGERVSRKVKGKNKEKAEKTSKNFQLLDLSGKILSNYKNM